MKVDAKKVMDSKTVQNPFLPQNMVKSVKKFPAETPVSAKKKSKRSPEKKK